MLITTDKHLVCSDKDFNFKDLNFEKILNAGYVPTCILGNADNPGTGFLIGISEDRSAGYIKFQRLPNHRPGDKLNDDITERSDEYTEFKILFESPRSLALLTATLYDLLRKFSPEELEKEDTKQYIDYIRNK